MNTIRFSLITVISLLVLCESSFAQTKLQKKKRKSDGVTVKGRIVQPSKSEFQIDLNNLKCMLNQQVQLPDPPVPKDEWPKMTPEQQTQWVKNFEASEEFKTFLADRKRRLEAAERFEIQLESNGNFVLYDVPPGSYGIRGRAEKLVNEKNYVFEVFGSIEIADVEEVLLDPMNVLVTRLTKADEAIPTVEIKTFDGKATINNELLKNRNILVSFWSLNSPPSIKETELVQQIFKKVKSQQPVQLLSICLDCDRKKALQHIRENDLQGWHGYAPNWEHETVSEFGVRIIPAMFLLSADGKIKMSQWDFRNLMRVPDTDLSKVIVDVLSGKSVPTPVRTNAEGSPNKNN